MSPPSTTLKGKLVVNGPCGFYAIQVLSGNIDSSKVQKIWKFTMGPTDTVYTNVFRAANICTFGSYGISQNDTFSFQLTDTVSFQPCAVCEIAAPPGLTMSNPVTHVQRQ